MKKLLTSSAIILMALFTLAPLASAANPQERREDRQREEQRRELNRRRVEPRFRLNFGFGQPYGYRYQPYGYYEPHGYVESAGFVRLHFPYQAQVWVDGNFTGNDLHNVTLSPGTHEIALQDAYGNIMFEQTVNVIPGRTIDVFTQG